MDLLDNKEKDKKERHYLEVIRRPKQEVSMCTCGHSKTLPLCDDSHREINEQQGTNYKSFKLYNPSNETIIDKVYCSNWKKPEEKKE